MIPCSSSSFPGSLVHQWGWGWEWGATQCFFPPQLVCIWTEDKSAGKVGLELVNPNTLGVVGVSSFCGPLGPEFPQAPVMVKSSLDTRMSTKHSPLPHEFWFHRSGWALRVDKAPLVIPAPWLGRVSQMPQGDGAGKAGGCSHWICPGAPRRLPHSAVWGLFLLIALAQGEWTNEALVSLAGFLSTTTKFCHHFMRMSYLDWVWIGFMEIIFILGSQFPQGVSDLHLGHFLTTLDSG